MNFLENTHYLLNAKLLREKVPSFEHYPFNLDVVSNFDSLEFHPKVTFIIGENGSHQLVEQESQFITATHSPIILAYPNSKIYELRDGKLGECNYENTEHYSVSKKFLNNYKNFLGELLEQ